MRVLVGFAYDKQDKLIAVKVFRSVDAFEEYSAHCSDKIKRWETGWRDVIDEF